MKYRIDTTLFLDSLNDAEMALKAIKGFEHLFRTINKGKETEERSSIRLHECYHDEDPVKPCKVISEWESD